MWNFVSCSKITEEKIRRQSYEKHIQKIKRAKGSLKIEEPEQPWFIYCKKKQQLARNSQLLQIEKNNHLLLSKIEKINHRQNKTYKKPTFLATLNGKLMQENSKTIIKQNRRICDKILKTNSTYKIRDILEQSQNIQKLKENITLNARRCQSAKHYNSRIATTRPSSVFKTRPNSSSSHKNYHKFILSSSKEKPRQFSINENTLLRPDSAPSVKRKIQLITPQKEC